MREGITAAQHITIREFNDFTGPQRTSVYVRAVFAVQVFDQSAGVIKIDLSVFAGNTVIVTSNIDGTQLPDGSHAASL